MDLLNRPPGPQVVLTFKVKLMGSHHDGAASNLTEHLLQYCCFTDEELEALRGLGP